MAVPNLLAGYKFLLSRGDGGQPETFLYLCTVTTRKISQKLEFDDAMLQDCDSPGQLPIRVSVPKGKTWDGTFSGKVDALRLPTLQGDFDGGMVHSYRFEFRLSGGQGGGYYQGQAFVETLDIESSENGITSFSATLRGQGDLWWTAAP
jgi:hypothetical protein